MVIDRDANTGRSRDRQTNRYTESLIWIRGYVGGSESQRKRRLLITLKNTVALGNLTRFSLNICQFSFSREIQVAPWSAKVSSMPSSLGAINVALPTNLESTPYWLRNTRVGSKASLPHPVRTEIVNGFLDLPVTCFFLWNVLADQFHLQMQLTIGSLHSTVGAYFCALRTHFVYCCLGRSK